MKEIKDKTGNLVLCIDTQHAEPVALTGKDGRNVLWEGNPAYWDKHDPILFPTIGKSFEGKIRIEGNVYDMPKHGFAQQGPWTVVEENPQEGHLVLELTETEASLKLYPFSFRVRQTFDLSDDHTLRVGWSVESPKEMPFMMGAHPAFVLPDFNPDDEVHGYLQLDIPELVSQRVLPDGYLHEDATTTELKDHLLPLTNDTFACDTLLDIRGMNRSVTLLNKNKKPLVTLRHEMPVIAFWAPKNGCCPFVCIEPWFGGCDKPGYDGEFAERAFVQHVTPGNIWTTSYTIELK